MSTLFRHISEIIFLISPRPLHFAAVHAILFSWSSFPSRPIGDFPWRSPFRAAEIPSPFFIIFIKTRRKRTFRFQRSPAATASALRQRRTSPLWKSSARRGGCRSRYSARTCPQEPNKAAATSKRRGACSAANAIGRCSTGARTPCSPPITATIMQRPCSSALPAARRCKGLTSSLRRKGSCGRSSASRGRASTNISKRTPCPFGRTRRTQTSPSPATASATRCCPRSNGRCRGRRKISSALPSAPSATMRFCRNLPCAK